MSKAYSVLKVKNFDNEARTITGIASTPRQDRDNDMMEMKGVKFALPIPLLWQHNHNNPIGEVNSAEVTDEGILITATIAKIDEEGALKSRIDEAWQSIKSGLVKCLSIGFRPLEYNYIEDSYGLHIKEWEWYELSVVTVPANPDAVITSAKQIKKAFSEAQKKEVDVTINEHNPENSQADDKVAELVRQQVENALQDPKPDPIPDTEESQNPVASVAGDTPSHVALIDPAAGAIPLIDGV